MMDGLRWSNTVRRWQLVMPQRYVLPMWRSLKRRPNYFNAAGVERRTHRAVAKQGVDGDAPPFFDERGRNHGQVIFGSADIKLADDE